MKALLRLTIFAALLQTTPSVSASVLSDDGSSLTNLNVAGWLYDITFSEGIMSEVFAGVVFNDARRTEANLVSEYTANALELLGVSGTDIYGCEHQWRCFLLNPDNLNQLYQDEDVANWFIADGWDTSGGGFGSLVNNNTALVDSATILTYNRTGRAPVPVPASLALISFGLAFLTLRRIRDGSNN